MTRGRGYTHAMVLRRALAVPGLLILAACAAPAPEALKAADQGPGAKVKFDVFHKPLPDVPLPNDFASRFDALSPTKKRVNASIEIAPTQWEKYTRAGLDALSGWGTLAAVSVQFTAPLDLRNIIARHQGDLLNFNNDAVLVIDVTAGSNELCKAVPLDLGQGNYPTTLPSLNLYSSDPRKSLQQLQFEETEEDVNRNGLLDPGEDTDMDGVLDHPNTLSGIAGDPVLDFYERETNTLIMKPMMPMQEATTYAVVLTKRLTDANGDQVRSPFEGINHASQTKALNKLPECLGLYGLTLSDVAFTWSFTTQSITDDYKKVRDGLYGQGSLAHVGTAYPPVITKLFDLKPRGPGINSTVLGNDQVEGLLKALFEATKSGGAQGETLLELQKFVDFHVMGEIASPQFFPRADADGKPLPLYKQTWNLDEAPRTEAVQFWLFVPKNRGSGPVPVSIFVHGHGGSTYAGLEVAGALARYGVATLAINAPSHGVTLDATTLSLVESVFAARGLAGFGKALLTGRAIDFNGDGQVDSGADYWTSYVLHTRDMVRQTMVDVMQVVRVLRSFDGQQRWAYDVNKDGQLDLAGDFNGDGIVDVGGAQPLQISGGSLGGIIAAVAAGVEPQLDSAISIVPGGMLSEIGARSSLGGVRNAMVLRLISPLLTNENGVLTVTGPEAQGYEANLGVHALPSLSPNDTVVAFNLKTHEHRCGLVQSDGKFRVAVPSDEGDLLELRAYAGTLKPEERSGCAVPAGVEPLFTINSLDRDGKVGGRTFDKGSPLTAFTDGFGLRRGSPEIRRMLSLAQVGLEAADPMNLAPYWEQHRTLAYGTGETVSTRVIMMPSVGDTGVPVATGVALARAAGFIEFDKVDPRYGKSQNQQLIDSWAVEGLSRMSRYQQAGTGNGVLMDLEYLSSITGSDDGYGVPRLTPPLRLTKYRPVPDGITGLQFIMLKPEGAHGFAIPNKEAKFDLGSLLANQIGRYAGTAGKSFGYEACQVDSTCPWIQHLPK